MAESNPTTTKDLAAKQAEESKKSREEAEKRMASSKPTPTQEENDRAKLGEKIESHEDDGSGPEPKFGSVITREATADKPAGGYATRQSKPAPASGGGSSS